VVKADAYGLGVARVAPALEKAGCRDFFVATTEGDNRTDSTVKIFAPNIELD